MMRDRYPAMTGGMAAIALVAAYDGLLLTIVGSLWAAATGLPHPRVVSLLGGTLLVAWGMLFLAGVYALGRGRSWGCKVLRGSFTAILPLQALAIFPVFQNQAMTSGNTLLQGVSMLSGVLALRGLQRRQAPQWEIGRPEPVSSSTPDGPDDPTEERVFTFDRHGAGST